MAISKERKKELVSDYVDKMKESEGIILTDYRGLTVANITELRRRMREAEGVYQVVKNTLFELALEKVGKSIPSDELEGPVAVGYCLGDTPPVAKVLVDFAKETQVLEIRGALLGTDYLGVDAVQSLADLPSREILLAQLVSAVQGPMSSLVNALNAPMRELAQVLQARSEQGGEQEAAA